MPPIFTESVDDVTIDYDLHTAGDGSAKLVATVSKRYVLSAPSALGPGRADMAWSASSISLFDKLIWTEIPVGGLKL